MTTQSTTTDTRRPTTSRHDPRLPAALLLAALAFVASLTFFWMYGVPPLVLAAGAVVLLVLAHRDAGRLPRMGVLAAALVGIALVCDVVFVALNASSLY
jgi:hypothetical protein